MQVEFFVLSDTNPDAHLRQACRVAEQAVDEGRTVFIRVADTEASRLDELMWTFGDRSFVPHEIAQSDSPSHPRIRVLIGSEPSARFGDVIVNLCSDVPSQTYSATRIAEFVPPDADRKRQARERFKIYRERGIEPVTHTL